jgi:hypothetical protein
MSSSWHRLLAETAVIRRTPVAHRDGVMTFISGFQVPEAFRHLENEEHCTFELQYLDEGENTKDIALPNGAIVCIGKQSGRIFAVHLPKRLIKDAIRERLAKGTAAANAVQALHSIQTQGRLRPGHLDNYRVTESLFRQHTPIFESPR